MKLGKVIGEVVSTHKIPEIENLKFSLVERMDAKEKSTGEIVVSVDLVTSGQGDLVLYTSGSSARKALANKELPIDHVTVAIVDKVYKTD